jgi:beta-galactosidase
MDAARPAVQIADGAVVVRGQPTFLWGGDLHYFRVRDADGDVGRTHAAWAATLDQMKAAGCNHVTTYVPWDVHATSPGSFDFSGTRDLRAFLTMAKERGLHVILKPGPLITGEWPRGFGTFGAVPAWWKAAHPESLERGANGKPFSFHPLGVKDQRQPAMLDPTYLQAVDAWYARFVDEVRPFLGDTVIGLQLDNETNGYWADRLGGVGYSPSSVEHWRGFLHDRYGSVDALNAAWGTKLRSFDEATPPAKAILGRVAKKDEVRVRDWYDGGKALIVDYLARLRTMLEAKGVDGVLFTTNDSPFTISAGDIPLRNAVLLPDGSKNDVAVNVLDLYPTFGSKKTAPLGEPFQTDFFTRLFDRRADRATGAQDWIYGAELQGGMYNIGRNRPDIPSEATDTMLLRAFAGGMKGGAMYVVRDGLNADGRDYSYGAPFAADGAPSPRHAVFAKWGAFLQDQGPALLQAKAVTNRVAVVVDGKDAAPAADAENRQRLRAVEDPALYGWLASAGFAVDVIDKDDLLSRSPDERARYRAVVLQTPKSLSTDEQARLKAHVDDDGALVTFLAAPEGAPLAEAGAWHWPNARRRGEITASIPGFQGRLDSAWNARFLDGAACPAGVDVIARERTALGRDGRALGYVDRRERVAHVHVGTNVFHTFNTAEFYTAPASRLRAATAFARSLLEVAGERPIVDTGNPRVQCTPRAAPDRLFLFVENAQPDGTRAELRLRDDAASQFGIDPARRYVLRDELNARDLGEATGAQLLNQGIAVDVAAMGTAVVVVRPA